ncbi:MAG TPA: formylglycine-generating enzyme family protein [Gemmataceae bacterium]|nr:formylglycine-generating enzyme family protein [Gemmataceae bacterium]
MRSLSQVPLGWCVLLAGVGLAVATALLPSGGGQAAAKEDSPRPASQKAYTETVPGSKVKFDMVPIPAGTFDMGSPKGEAGRSDDEGPQHPVKIQPFWMGKTEVTWDEYDIYRKAEGVEEPKQNDERLKTNADAITGPTPPYADETFGHGRERHPVLCITHHAAMEYCRWLSTKTGKTYRLPTEAEWEYACRAGTKTTYFFGDDPKKLDDYAWYAGTSDEQTHEVGSKKPNPWGLYDMYGNVAEWCLDSYKKDFYAGSQADKPTLEPVLLPTANRFPNVARGGSWADEANRCRSAARRASDKSWIKQDPQRPQSIWWLTDAQFVGFRVIRPVDELPRLKGLRSKVTLESK